MRQLSRGANTLASTLTRAAQVSLVCLTASTLVSCSEVPAGKRKYACRPGDECVSQIQADIAVQQGLSMKRAIAKGCDIPAPVWNAGDRTQWDQSFANAQLCFSNIANGLPVNEGVSPGGALAGDQPPYQDAQGQDLDYGSEPINFEPPQ